MSLTITSTVNHLTYVKFTQGTLSCIEVDTFTYKERLIRLHPAGDNILLVSSHPGLCISLQASANCPGLTSPTAEMRGHFLLRRSACWLLQSCLWGRSSERQPCFRGLPVYGYCSLWHTQALAAHESWGPCALHARLLKRTSMNWSCSGQQQPWPLRWSLNQ